MLKQIYNDWIAQRQDPGRFFISIFNAVRTASESKLTHDEFYRKYFRVHSVDIRPDDPSHNLSNSQIIDNWVHRYQREYEHRMAEITNDWTMWPLAVCFARFELEIWDHRVSLTPNGLSVLMLTNEVTYARIGGVDHNFLTDWTPIDSGMKNILLRADGQSVGSFFTEHVGLAEKSLLAIGKSCFYLPAQLEQSGGFADFLDRQPEAFAVRTPGSGTVLRPRISSPR